MGWVDGWLIVIVTVFNEQTLGNKLGGVLSLDENGDSLRCVGFDQQPGSFASGWCSIVCTEWTIHSVMSCRQPYLIAFIGRALFVIDGAPLGLN